MDDDEANMQLVLSNSQGELKPLEIGRHAFNTVGKATPGRGKKSGLSAYARRLGVTQQYMSLLHQAGEVYARYEKSTTQVVDLGDKAKHLAAIHKAPEDTWLVLATQLLAADWSVDDTETAVKRVNDLLHAVPDWWIGLDRPGLAALAALVWRDVIAEATPDA